MVDWKMNVPKGQKPEVGHDYWYRSGGGHQIFIWKAKKYLTPV